MRHIRLLARLVELGWSVEACYTAYGDPPRGCRGSIDYRTMRHEFRQFTHSLKPTAAPPFKGAGHSLRFVVVPRLPVPWQDRTVVSGWGGLAKFVRNHSRTHKENKDEKQAEKA